MDVQQYTDRLRNLLLPSQYSREVLVDSETPLLLVSGLLLGRYALAVFPWESSIDGSTQLRRARRKVANRLWAFPILSEVGLYAVFVGPKALWSQHLESMTADRTGIHRVIIQAVHFVDLETPESRLNQSTWGSIHFGGVDSISPIINKALH